MGMRKKFLCYIADYMPDSDKYRIENKPLMDEICNLFDVTLDEIELRLWSVNRVAVYKKIGASGGTQ